MKNKTLLFDFDGTLVDSLSLVQKILNDLSTKHNFKRIEDEDLQMLRGKGPKEVMKHLNVSLIKIPFIAVDLKKEFHKDLHTVSLITGIKEALEGLHKKGVVLGVLTSNAKENVEAYLQLQGIDCIDFIYADVHVFGKAKSIEKALKANGIEKKDVLYVGDEIRDIEAAKKAGIKMIAVGWGFNAEEALRNASPDYLVTHPKELDLISN